MQILVVVAGSMIEGQGRTRPRHGVKAAWPTLGVASVTGIMLSRKEEEINGTEESKKV